MTSHPVDAEYRRLMADPFWLGEFASEALQQSPGLRRAMANEDWIAFGSALKLRVSDAALAQATANVAREQREAAA